MNQRPQFETKNTKTARRKYRQFPIRYRLGEDFEQDSICPGIKINN